MKKIVIMLSLIITSNLCVLASNPTIDKMENSLFGITYPKDNETKRIERLEKSVYGKTNSGNIQNRISRLKKDLNADLIGQEITPKEDTFMNDDDYIVYEKEPAEAANMDYPVINELEKQVFQKESKGENIKSRLSKLEQKTFNKTYDKDDLSTRVDRLRAQLKPKTFMSNGMQQQENNFYQYTPSKMAQNYHLDSYGAPFDYDAYNSNYNYTDYNADNTAPPSTKPLNLSTIEKKLYKRRFDNQATSERLSRIESTVFGTTFANDSDSERIQRISSAIQAQKSARRYDSNRFNQNVATAFQIGTLILMVLACIL